MAKEIVYNNGVFTLTVQNLQHGQGKLTLTMNTPITKWVSAETVLEALKDIAKSTEELEFNYHLRNLIKDEIKATEDKPVAESEESA